MNYSTSYSYDGDARLTGQVDTNDDGSQLRRRTVVYDDAAQTRTTTKVAADARENFTRVDTFKDGLRVKYVSTNGRGVVSTYEPHFDGNHVVDETFTVGGLRTVISYKYCK